MPEKDTTPTQKIEAGERSRNIQVGRDYNHYEAPKPSPIHRPSQADVELYDSKFGEIRRQALLESMRGRVRCEQSSNRKAQRRGLRFYFWLTLLIWIFLWFFA